MENETFNHVNGGANYNSTTQEDPASSSSTSLEGGQQQHKELFHEEVSDSNKPWWSKPQFFVVEPVLFGTWDGVFTSCLINIFGVVLFLRTGWMVGNVGIGLAILIVFITITVALLAALSAIGVCERLQDVQTGGVYYLVSHVLGGKIGGTLGVMYAFGLSVVAALYCTGFAESVVEVIGWDSIWAVRGVAIVTLLLLLGINLAGVKWVIRMQLLLLLVLIISTTDFFIGTLVHTDPDAGFVGYSKAVIRNNTGPSYQLHENFFTVFGVFFPTATGVMAGVNMSGDLRNPAKSIPNGTLSALALSFVLYLVFVLLLGSTCWRYALQTDFMIAEKVSAVGVLWLMGVYMSSTSSCSTGLYGAPRVLQSLANQNAVPAIKFLGKGFGANKTPVLAICASGFIALLFIFVGQLNAISPIITCNFMLVYAIVDYSYFALAMTYDMRKKNMERYKEQLRKDSHHSSGYGGMSDRNHGTMTEFTQDMDTIRMYNSSVTTGQAENKPNVENANGGTTIATKEDVKEKTGREYLHESFLLPPSTSKSNEEEETLFDGTSEPTRASRADEEEVVSEMKEVDLKVENENNNNTNHQHADPQHAEISSSSSDEALAVVDCNNVAMSTDNDKSELIDIEKRKKKKRKKKRERVQSEGSGTETTQEHDHYIEILRQPDSWYKHMCNRWAALFGVVITVVVMFLIQWLYALMNILAFLLIYTYISIANPGANPGVAAEFSFLEWFKGLFDCCRKTPAQPEQIVIPPSSGAPYSVVQEQLNSDNEDFKDRGRYHQASIGDYDFSSSESTLLK